MIGTKGAYARYRKSHGWPGGTRQSVQKAVETNRIPLTADGKVDFEVADAAWLANTSTLQQERGAGGGFRSSAVVVGQSKSPPADKVDPEEYLAARARREAAQADLAEIEAQELRGETGRVSDFDAWWQEMVIAFRSRMLVLPPTAAPIVVSKTPAEAQAILQSMVYEALGELAGDGVPRRIRERLQARVQPT